MSLEPTGLVVHRPGVQPAAGRESSSRRFPVQPPTLSTTGIVPQRQNALAVPYTPASATSLSTPFSAHVSAGASPLAQAPSVASSPMATRSATSLVAPYDPRQWGQSNLPRGGYGSQVPLSPAPPQGEITGMEGRSCFILLNCIKSSEVYFVPTSSFRCFL